MKTARYDKVILPMDIAIGMSTIISALSPLVCITEMIGTPIAILYQLIAVHNYNVLYLCILWGIFIFDFLISLLLINAVSPGMTEIEREYEETKDKKLIQQFWLRFLCFLLTFAFCLSGTLLFIFFVL